MLSVGGTFVTEQVGGDYGDFYEALGLPRPHVRCFDRALATQQLERAGLTVIDSNGAVEEATFADVGAVAWYLRLIPWTVDGFSVRRHYDRLIRLQERIEREGPLTARLPAFWLVARS